MLLSGDDVANQLGSTIHPETQTSAHHFDLTVGKVYEHTGIGQVDFGGSELQAAPRREVKAEKNAPNDKYGWWIIEDGTYFIQFNETPELTEGQTGLVSPHQRFLQAGSYHPTFSIDSETETLETLISVGMPGIRIKENSRIATMLMFNTDR